MSVEIDQSEEEAFNSSKSKRADKLREYYFPTKEPSQQETEKIPKKKRPSIVSSVDPNQLPQVNYSTLGIDVEQLDSTISFNVESFVNDTLGEFGWTPSHELQLSQTLNLDDFKLETTAYLDNQCLELIQKAYKSTSLTCRGGKVYDTKELTDLVTLEKIQNDFDSLRVITETVETIIPKSQTLDNLKGYLKDVKEDEKINEFSEVCDIVRDLSQVLKQVEDNYIDNNSDNEAFAIIAFYKLRQMEINGITKQHLDVLNEAITSYENKANPKDFEKLKKIQIFANFIGEHLSS
ncbi:hypothetical protein H8356DRAFT_1086018 [Neocallimastix lanati (nom. inval.)]|jgi:hypothetical protein|uniref:Uncharacterized protein n=1 Tax=Neocallimastix californiae TaxID=1754190 RepID=A0A1Y2CQZ8_9FUNG|nr:hypothetical protein H8356DRAFT_1086018 [Neocallimastix sp. JGI-2020a]ORY48775.1 hypothetical protein LY90DRAFT_508803 [Neocallimastix californiae]|eukprot:ORY48775.1 hypothetical protein LY90DRAFT_508803 [Neocallimastix californiae]